MTSHQMNPQDGALGVATETVGATKLLAAGGYKVYDLTLTAPLTLSLPSYIQLGYKEVIEVWLRQPASGKAVTLPSGVTWEEGTAPTISTVANSVTVLWFSTVDGGVTWSGRSSGEASDAGLAATVTTLSSTVTSQGTTLTSQGTALTALQALVTGSSTGYGAPTNGAKTASFDATTIDLPTLAAVVAQLIVDLEAGKLPAA